MLVVRNNRVFAGQELERISALSALIRSREEFSDENVLLHDEASKYPSSMVRVLNESSLNNYFIPRQLGGRLLRFDEMAIAMRQIYRVDAALGLGYGMTTFMASIVVWCFGSKSQKEKVASEIKKHQTISIAFHEKNHGNDVLSNEVKANRNDLCYQIEGQKFVINNARESRMFVLFSKTSDSGGCKGFSNILVEKKKSHLLTIKYPKKVKTLGVRSCRITGLILNNAVVGLDAIIGDAGSGFEQTLKSFQITKTILANVAIGSIDRYLTLTFNQFKSSFKSPYSKYVAVKSYAEFICTDILSMIFVRGLQALTKEMCIYSYVAKYTVSKIAKRIFPSMRKILGHESMLKDGPNGILEKIQRDFSVLDLGHAGSTICLSSISPHLKKLVSKKNECRLTITDVKTIFDNTQDLPEFDSINLKLLMKNGDVFISLFNYFKNDIAINMESKAINRAMDLISIELERLKNDLIKKDGREISRDLSLADRYCGAVSAIVTLIYYWVNKSTYTGLVMNSSLFVEFMIRLVPDCNPSEFISDSDIEKWFISASESSESNNTFSLFGEFINN